MGFNASLSLATHVIYLILHNHLKVVEALALIRHFLGQDYCRWPIRVLIAVLSASKRLAISKHNNATVFAAIECSLSFLVVVISSPDSFGGDDRVADKTTKLVCEISSR